jgi:ABC-type nitrate/sulfonate/bicarbonate transport system substrate-binding protein
MNPVHESYQMNELESCVKIRNLAPSLEKTSRTRDIDPSSKPFNGVSLTVSRHRSSPLVRVGYVPLIDAAPLIVAQEHGFFEAVGLRVDLDRQIGWGNVRDRLLYGQLDAAHALLGLAISSALSLDAHDTTPPILNVMSLGTGGDAITLSRRLTDRGIDSGGALALHVQQTRSEVPLRMGHVFGCSVHQYLLREWLARAGIDPDAQLRLSVVPPMLTASQMGQGHLDGFCVGEPWNLLAQRERTGHIVALTTDILESHPDKMFAVRRSLLEQDPSVVFRLIEALLHACAYCAESKNHFELARLLARSEYLNVDAEAINASLALDRHFKPRTGGGPSRKAGWHMRSFAPPSLFPNIGFGVWLIEQMQRWGHADAGIDAAKLAARVTHTDSYREAAATLGIACPERDLVPLSPFPEPVSLVSRI